MKDPIEEMLDEIFGEDVEYEQAGVIHGESIEAAKENMRERAENHDMELLEYMDFINNLESIMDFMEHAPAEAIEDGMTDIFETSESIGLNHIAQKMVGISGERAQERKEITREKFEILAEAARDIKEVEK